MSSKIAAEAIVDFLISAKVPYFIGFPGHTTTELLDACYKKQDKIGTILVRHEEVASFMADGYYRVTHKPLGVWAHTGPGAANAIIGVAGAFFDSSSMLVFTGEPWTKYHGRGAYQEVYQYTDADMPALFKPITKRSWQINSADVERLMEILTRGYKAAVTGRPGPVHFDLTQESLVQKTDQQIPDITKYIPDSRTRPQDEAVVRAADLLASAERPVILAGGGVLVSEASAELLELVELLGAPAVTTIMGKGAISEDHPLSLGTIGTWGTKQANAATNSSDVLLAVGTRFTETDTSSWLPGYTFTIPPTKLIHADIDAYEIGKYYPTELGVISDAKMFLRDLITRLKELVTKERDLPWVKEMLKLKQEWQKELSNLQNKQTSLVNPAALVRSVREILPKDGYLVTDIGNHHKWFAQQFATLVPRTVIGSMGFAPMGFGPCAALGVKLARPDKPVLSVSGDGGFTMVSHVLATAKEYNLPVVYCILNDFRLGSIYGMQKGFHYNGRFLGTNFKIAKTGEDYNPDFVQLAKAYKCDGKMVDNIEDFNRTLKGALGQSEPYLIEVRIDKDMRWLPSGGTWVIPTPS